MNHDCMHCEHDYEKGRNDDAEKGSASQHDAIVSTALLIIAAALHEARALKLFFSQKKSFY